MPVRAPQPADATLPEFGPAEQAPPLEVTWLRQPDPGVRFAIDPGSGETSCEIRRDFAAGQRFPSGLEYRDHDPATLTIRDGEPLSCAVGMRRRIEQGRGDWRTRIELRSRDDRRRHRLPAVDLDRRLRRGHPRAQPSVHLARAEEPLVIAGRLDNIDVVCTAIEPMRRFYVELLGLSLRLPYEPGQGWIGLRAGDVVIYLIEEDAATLPPHPAPRFTGAANPPGIDSFAFEVDQLDDAIARARHRTASPGRARSSSPSGTATADCTIPRATSST